MSQVTSNEILDLLPDGILVSDAGGHITYANRQAAEIFGYSREGLVGTSIESLLPEAMREAHATYRETFGRDPKARSMGGGATLQGLHQDGRLIDVEISLSPISGGQVVAVVRDVRAKRALEGALELSEGRLKTLLSNVDDILYFVSGSPFAGTVTFVSEKVTEVTGFRPSDFERDRSLWFSLLHPDDMPSVQESTNRLMRSGGTVTRQFRLKSKSGRYLWFEDRVTLQRGKDGSPTGICGVARDVTLRRDLESQLAQVQKMDAVGRLAGGVAHDFNNLLTVISGFSSLLQRAVPEDSSAYSYTTHIENAARRATALTRRLLSFSRQKAAHLQVVNLHATIEDVHEMLRRVIPENIDFRWVPGSGQPTVFADDNHVEQILINLVVNARDAMPDGGTLTIGCSELALGPTDLGSYPELTPGKYVVLTVVDSGHGIDEETLKHIFDPFFTTKDIGLGSGLGLSIVYGIVRQIGGCIRVTSQVGVGTTVSICLPVTDRVVAAVEPELPRRIQRGTERVLVVDDEAEVAELIQAVLQNHGYSVVTANEPLKALDVLRGTKEPFALVLTDVIMPGMSGLQLARQIESEWPNIRVLFMSGHVPESLDRDLIDPRHFLAKPFGADQLLEKLRTTLDHNSAIS